MARKCRMFTSGCRVGETNCCYNSRLPPTSLSTVCYRGKKKVQLIEVGSVETVVGSANSDKLSGSPSCVATYTAFRGLGYEVKYGGKITNGTLFWVRAFARLCFAVA